MTTRQELDSAERRAINGRICGLDTRLQCARSELVERPEGMAAARNIERRRLREHEIKLVEAGAAAREVAKRRGKPYSRERRRANRDLDLDRALETLLAGPDPAVPAST